jgi:pilus assembly protein Flp/PilA
MILLRTFIEDESGADAIEYGIIVALIFLIIVVSVVNMANQAVAMWGDISSHM